MDQNANAVEADPVRKAPPMNLRRAAGLARYRLFRAAWEGLMRASFLSPILPRTGLAVGAMALAASVASAQIERLPETSRGEARANQINRDIESQQQTRGIVQQQQFETNQLRTQIQTAPSPPPVVAPPIVSPR
jgi:hypothetical protein